MVMQSLKAAQLIQTPACVCRWVEEYHVDGFRFDLAACLCRDPHGEPMQAPPVIREISKDPVLSKVRQACCQPVWGFSRGSEAAAAGMRGRVAGERRCGSIMAAMHALGAACRPGLPRQMHARQMTTWQLHEVPWHDAARADTRETAADKGPCEGFGDCCSKARICTCCGRHVFL